MLKSGKKLDLLSAKMTFLETNLAKIIADPKCARQELSNDVSHVYVSSKIRKEPNTSKQSADKKVNKQLKM